MELDEAKKIAEKYLIEIQNECPDEIAINNELTIHHETGFVFHYNKKRFWDTKDIDDSLFGNGPILVKNDGELVILPTHQSAIKSLENL